MLPPSVWTTGNNEHTDEDGHGEGNIFMEQLPQHTHLFVELDDNKPTVSGLHSGQGGHRKKSEENDGVRLGEDKYSSSEQQKREGIDEKYLK